MNSIQRGPAGFAIIEALIALVIMGFGMLSLSSMQMSLSRTADNVRQRTEAQCLAQEKMEEFRAYTGIASTVTSAGSVNAAALNWNTLTDGQDSLTRNAVYLRSWTFGGSTESPMRAATVRVAWTDRSNATQTVALSSVLSRTDPLDTGLLGFPLPLNSPSKRANNRSLSIPIAAIGLANGLSALAFGSAGHYILLDNISANVVQSCTPSGLSAASSPAEIIAAFQNAESRHCKTLAAYMLSGYVGRDSSVSANDWNAIQTSLGIDTSGIGRNTAGTLGISCQLDNAINPASGAIIPDYKYYLCVIPLAAPAANQTYDWSGQIRLAGPAAWNGSGNTYYVCRYEYAASKDLTDPNRRNLQPYSRVNTSINQQNYLVASTSNTTSKTPPVCPSSMNVANVSSGVLQQDCRSASNPSGHATDCPLLGTAP